MFSFFDRKDVRKILKRKDSDPGEQEFTGSHLWCICLSGKELEKQWKTFNLDKHDDVITKVSEVTGNWSVVIMMPYLDPPGVFSFDWSFSNASIILASAVLGFLLQWSGALALRETSAVTHAILGQFKTCVILLGGFLLFGSNPGTTSICGAITALCGMSYYTHLNLRKQQQSIKTSSKQASFSLPKSMLSKENGEKHELVLQDESV
uniref:Sugar phosphate transporter domain-containing protein n=1 Tax=Daucus carota subsp. sativus TaxID=79200 RepID=A0A161XSU5_DAUCS